MQYKPHSRKALSLAIAAGFCGLSIAAQADDFMIEEVLVTAQKRVESAQEIPVSVTAIGADMIADLGIQSTQDLVKVAPSLTVREANTSQNSSFSIRGIGTSTYGIGVEQGVAVLVDEVAQVQPGQTMAGLMDIQQVEVLRGPQNTLYGKSASAGLISITTKGPSDELEGYVQFTATDDDETKVAASISGPLSDTVGYRLSAQWGDRDGYINNLTPGSKDKNGSEDTNVRGKLRWDISDIATADFTAYYMKTETNCCARVWTDLDPDAKVFGFLPGKIAEGITPGDDNLDFRGEDGPQNDATTTGGSVRFNIALGEFDLTSITAVDSWEFNTSQDVDFSDNDVLQYLSGGTEHGGLYSDGWFETEFFSQEIRLASPAYDNYDYIVGLYYSDSETQRTFFRNISLSPADYWGKAGSENLGLFGQLNLQFSDVTSASAGVRYISEEVSAGYVNNSNPSQGLLSGKDRDEVVVGKLALQHFFGEDMMAFASYSRGYKGQAYDVGLSFTEEKANSPIAPETSNSYEVGLKSTLWNQRLQLNVAAFLTSYENYQVQRVEFNDAGTLDVNLDNVGELETTGVELESIALLSENTTLTFNAAFVDAVINDYVGAACWVGQTEEQGCTSGIQEIDGGRLPYAPEWKYTAILDYQLPLKSLPFDAFANILYSWQDDTNYSLTQHPELTQDSYGVANMRIGLNDKADRYSVTLFVNNLFDKGYATSKLDLAKIYGGATAMAQVTPRNTQRYVGLQARFNFL